MNINSFDGNSNNNESYNNRILNAHNKYKIIETNGNCIDLLRFNSFIILHRKRTNKSMNRIANNVQILIEIICFQENFRITPEYRKSTSNEIFQIFVACFFFFSFLFPPKKTEHLTRVMYQSRGCFLDERLAIKLPAMEVTLLFFPVDG